MTPVTASELLAVVAARELRDDTTVFAGVGVPLLAAALAKRRHAPRLTLVIEGGIIGPEIAPGRLPISTNEMRAGRRATMLLGILGFDPDSRRMRIEAAHPGVSPATIREHTGFELGETAPIAVTEPPSEDELEYLRALDPERRFLG